MTLPENEDTCLQTPPSKRLKLEETSKESTSSKGESSTLLNFCDDVLLEVLSNLKPNDLLALSQCCQRLNCIVRDRTLWEDVDFRSTQQTQNELQKFVKLFLPCTKRIATKGTWSQPQMPAWDGETNFRTLVNEQDDLSQDILPTITKTLLEDIAENAPNLSSLILENHVLDCEDIKHNQIWEILPSQIEDLVLHQCHLTKCTNTPNSSDHSSQAIFAGICDYLPQLKKVDLTGCLWFRAHSLLALSKCQRLEELRMADCLLYEFVPYISLSTRFGFKSLRVVDLRRTWVSDREVSCLDKTLTLQELYLESPRGEMGSTLVSDLGVTAFGGTFEEWQEMGYVVMHFDGHKVGASSPSPLRVLELSNYTSVTDTSLRHCASCLKGLQQLNIRGTSCTQAGVIKFKSQRPDVIIQSDFNLEVDGDSNQNNSFES